MLFIFMGQSATGKSTVGEKIKETINADLYVDKDYVRLAKDSDEAWKKFMLRLETATKDGQDNVIYIVTDIELYNKVKNIKGAIKVKFEANIETVKCRFSKKLDGNITRPIESMLEKTLREWKEIVGDLKVDTSGVASPDEVGGRILRLSRSIVSYMHIDEEWRI